MDIGVDTGKKCPFCGENILSFFKRCPYCGSLLIIDSKNKEPDDDSFFREKEDDGTNNFSGYVPTQTSGSIGESTDSSKSTDYAPRSMPIVSQEDSKLSNGLKVFLTIICTIIPAFGQLAGIIIAIILINDQKDSDRRSFGTALLIASIIFFLISCFILFLAMLAVFTAQA